MKQSIRKKLIHVSWTRLQCYLKKINIIISVRRTAVLGTKMKTFLRRFIITPLMNAIDLDDPIEMLTEMRNVVIVFANFVVRETASLALIKTVDSIYNKLCE